MIQNSCRMLSLKHFTFDLYHCLISFLIFLWCRTDDLSSLLLSFCSPFVSLSIHSSLLLYSLPLFLVLFVIPSMFLLSQSSLCLAYDVLQFNLRPLWVGGRGLAHGGEHWNKAEGRKGGEWQGKRDRGQEAYPRVHSDSTPFLANMGSDWLKSAARFLSGDAVCGLQLERI